MLNRPLVSAAPGRPAGAAGQHRGALLVIASATLLVVLDSTIVNVALPKIQAGLGFSAAGLEWVIGAYALTFGGLLLLGGRSGDLLGRRRMFIAGLVTFSAGSLLGSVAAGPALLIAARFVQGAGAAIAAPTALSLIAITFPAGPERNRAMSVYATMSSAGGAVGLILGGVITELASWRWVFLVAVPVGLAAAWGAARTLPESGRQHARADIPGALAVTSGLSALAFGLTRAAQSAWTAPATLAALGGAAVLLALFALIEARSRQPLLPGRILADRGRAVAYGVTLAAGLALFGLTFFLMLYLQEILGYSSIQAGLAFLPLAGSVGAAAIIMGRVVGRIGPRPGVIGGPLLAAAGALWLATQVTPQAGYLQLAVPFAVFGAGLGAAFVPLTLTALATVAPAEAGIASALVSASQQIGAGLGLAALGTVVAAASQHPAGRSAAAVADAVTRGYRSAAYVTAAVLAAAFLLALTAPARRSPAGR
jgi:EmrB/QacA subfamily drug resistance transporter